MAIEKLTNAQLIFGLLQKRMGLSDQQLADAIYGDNANPSNLKKDIDWLIKMNLVKEHEGKYYGIVNRYSGEE